MVHNKIWRNRALGVMILILSVPLILYIYWSDRIHFPVFSCTFRWATGYHCPTCGLTRALHALLHGDFLRALRMNAFLTPFLPVLSYIVLAEILQLFFGRYALPQIPMNPWVITAIGAAFIFFGILRNLPAFYFLAPIP